MSEFKFSLCWYSSGIRERNRRWELGLRRQEGQLKNMFSESVFEIFILPAVINKV